MKRKNNQSVSVVIRIRVRTDRRFLRHRHRV